MKKDFFLVLIIGIIFALTFKARADVSDQLSSDCKTITVTGQDGIEVPYTYQYVNQQITASQQQRIIYLREAQKAGKVIEAFSPLKNEIETCLSNLQSNGTGTGG